MADPDINNVVLLANFIGTDGDTSYTPEVGGAFTFNADTHLEDTVTQFGNTMLYMDGTDDYATWGAAEDVEFLHNKTSDYCIEFWVRRPTIASTGYVFSTRNANRGVIFVIFSDGSWFYGVYSHAGSIVECWGSAGDFVAATTHYVKISASITTGVKVRIDGTVEATSSYDAPDVTTTGNLALTLGRNAGTTTGIHEVYIGPLRITEGETLDDNDVPVAIFPSTVTFTGYIDLPGPLGSPAIRALNDFSGLITDYRAFYVMEVSGSPILRIPISSWQATVQTDRASFLQCVIPAADAYVDDLLARLNSSNFSIYRITYLDGAEQKSQLAIAPLETTSYARGPSNYTLTVYGYGDAETASASPATRTMTGLRSIYTTSTGKTRARCDIDWFLRPGDTAVVDGENVTVSYINYYVPSIGDAYMDIGDR